MDNASFIASLQNPELRRDILLQANEETLATLPPDIAAEARVLQDRAYHNRYMIDYQGALDSTGLRNFLGRARDRENNNNQNSVPLK